MANLNLDPDEGVIITSRYVHCDGNDSRVFIDEMYLTNKNIVYVIEQSKKTGGFFSKSIKYNEVQKVPLSSVKVINGRVLAVQKKYDFKEYKLEIQFMHGIEEYYFSDDSKKTTAQWVDELNKICLSERLASRRSYYGQSQPQPNSQPLGINYCSMCGTQLSPGTRFCPGCGTPINSTTGQAPTSAYGNSETRQQEFAGTVVKCPNCGDTINYLDVVCPSCGFEIRGRSPSYSVQYLQEQLMAVEYSRKEKTLLGDLVQSFTGNVAEETAISSKKVTLIKSFPIPNTIEEISEFVLLASSNIDVRLSKVSIGTKWARVGNDAKANERSVSDAWVAKLEQAYQKAKLTFSDKPLFNDVERIYRDKMDELNM